MISQIKYWTGSLSLGYPGCRMMGVLVQQDYMRDYVRCSFLTEMAIAMAVRDPNPGGCESSPGPSLHFTGGTQVYSFA